MIRTNIRELHVMSVLLNGERFGRQINLEYEKATKERMPIGSLYTTLERMQEKGYIRSRDGEPNPEYGGNKRRYFSLTAKGRGAYESAVLSLTPPAVARV